MAGRKPKGADDAGLFASKDNEQEQKKTSLKSEAENPTTTGRPRGREEEEGAKARSEGEELPKRVRRAAERQGGRSKGPAGGHTASTGGKSVPVYVRVPEAMLEAIEKAVEGSPIEFGDRSEFIRRAIESELRRRGLVAQFK